MRRMMNVVVAIAGFVIAAIGVESAPADALEVRATDVVFFAGRTDITIPPLGEEGPDYPLFRPPGRQLWVETFPPSLSVNDGDTIRLVATGLTAMAGGSPDFPPTGKLGLISRIDGIDGISGYVGPSGALLGVFLDETVPSAGSPPATMDFTSAGLGIDG